MSQTAKVCHDHALADSRARERQRRNWVARGHEEISSDEGEDDAGFEGGAWRRGNVGEEEIDDQGSQYKDRWPEQYVNVPLHDWLPPDADSPGARSPSPTYSLEEELGLHRDFQALEIFDSDDDELVQGLLPVLQDDPEAVDLDRDPLRLAREDIFQPDDNDNPIEHQDLDTGDVDAPHTFQQPPAFSEDPAIRHAYIRAFISAAFCGSTQSAVTDALRGNATEFRGICDRYPGVHLEGLETMALSLRAVERRLGVSTDSLIAYYFLCPDCWAPHHPSTLYKLESPTCQKDTCSGLLFSEKQLSSRTRRVPTKVLSYTSPEKAMQHLLLRPGKYEQFQLWRTGDDQPAEVPPLQHTGLAAFDDLDRPMSDIYDGWMWKAAQSGLKRRKGGPWTIQDVDVLNVKQRFVALPCGLQVQLNLDWYVLRTAAACNHSDQIFRFQSVKNTSHSSGALYMTVLNNPRSVRFCRAKTALLMALPGPHEPDQDQLNEIMNLPVRSFLKLYDGMHLLLEHDSH
jgi:hypothetical protein